MYLLSFSTVDKNMKAKIGRSSCFSEAEARFHEQWCRSRRAARMGSRRPRKISLALNEGGKGEPES
jgi:hypothetical protein